MLICCKKKDNGNWYINNMIPILNQNRLFNIKNIFRAKLIHGKKAIVGKYLMVFCFK